MKWKILISSIKTCISSSPPAAKTNNNILFYYFQYLFMLVILLVAECVVSILAILCPQYLGLNLDREELQDSWQRNYGVPGREQYTAAVDLVQTQVIYFAYRPNILAKEGYDFD